MAEAFTVFDRDGSGYLTADEVMQILLRQGGGHPLSYQDAHQFINAFDINGDGVLNYSEFCMAFGNAPASGATSIGVRRDRTVQYDDAVGLASHVTWLKHGGERLERLLAVVPRLGDSPVRLVDARYFLTEIAGYRDEGSGYYSLMGAQPRILPKRQELPDKAFITLDQLRQMNHSQRGGQECLRIIVVSHMWLQPDHPDPKMTTVKDLAKAIMALVHDKGGTFGLFVDFMSVLQKDKAGNRTPQETELFKMVFEGQGMTSELYSHAGTYVFKVTKQPHGYPAGFSFPPGIQANQAEYDRRGWCYMESSVANFVKPAEIVIDLSKLPDTWETEVPNWDDYLRAGRLRGPPLVPVAFNERLQTMRFTTPAIDGPAVYEMYKSAFSSHYGAAEELEFQSMQWGDAEAIEFAQVISSGVLTNLKRLRLDKNNIGDVGMAELARSIATGGLPKLEKISLNSNPGDHGLVSRAVQQSPGGHGKPAKVGSSLRDQLDDDWQW